MQIRSQLYGQLDHGHSIHVVPSWPEMKPALAAVGSATIAVLSQSSGMVVYLFAHEH